MKYSKIILLFIAIAAGCTQQSSPPQNSESEGKGARYLALGDSYTIGESVAEAERWPVIFANDFRKSGKEIRSPEIIATTGWTTGDLLAALANFNPNEKYDIVSLLIGVNNQYQGQSIDTYRTEFRALLLKSIAYANNEPARVFVLSTPDWGVTIFGERNRERIAMEIDNFNRVAKEECEKEKVLFIDITPISRKALYDPTMIAKDQLHFSGKMHQMWVDEVLSKVKSRF